MLCGGGQPVCDCSLILRWCTHTLAQNTRAEPCLLNPAESFHAMQPSKSPSIIFAIVFGATVVWLLAASFNEQAEQSHQLRKMGVRVCSSLLGLALVAVAFLAATTSAADSACSKGDAPCFCSAIGGTWRALQAPLLPACKVTYQHQGAERYVHVYLPPSYDGSTQWPIWVHLHGVFWATMGDIGARVGHPVNGTDIIPAFDHSVEMLGDKAILVYPQATGDAGSGAPDEGQGAKYRQFWNIPFWRCSVGICRDPSIDDMGFIEKVVADLPKRLPLKPGHYLLTGESAGGMMVHAILCQSKVIPSMVDAAIDMLGGIGADYARGPACAAHTPIPFLKLHGIEDPFITYSRDILVDGVNFASSIEGTQLHAKANGCDPGDVGSKDVSEADGKMLCTDYCGGMPDKPAAKLCGMPTVGHDTDHPHPGFVYQQSWAWFQEQVKAAGGRRPAPKELVAKKGAKTAAATDADATDIAAADAMVLNITYPGASAGDFKDPKQASAALAAVSKATGLPAANISATYTPTAAAPVADEKGSAPSSKGGGRRLHLWRRLTAAKQAGAHVTGSYALDASNPAQVIEAVVAAVKDGSLLQSLRQAGLAAPAAAAGAGSRAQQGAPLVSLAAASQQVVLKPTDLAAAAAQKVPVTREPVTAAAKVDASSGSNAAAAAGGSVSAKDSTAGGTTWAPTASKGAGSSSSAQQPSAAVIAGAVVGGVCGAALLAGAAAWAVAARKRKQQQRQKQQQAAVAFEEAHSAAWDKQQQQQKQQQQRPGVINLNADAVMCISEETVEAKGWGRSWA